MKCSACGEPVGSGEGVDFFGSRFCSKCFIADAAKFHEELTPDQVAMLRSFGKELSGHLPPDVLRMVIIGFWRRATGKIDGPPPEELARLIAEIQRLAVFSNSRKILSLLQTWKGLFDEFVEGQEGEIRDGVRRLSEFE